MYVCTLHGWLYVYVCGDGGGWSGWGHALQIVSAHTWRRGDECVHVSSEKREKEMGRVRIK